MLSIGLKKGLEAGFGIVLLVTGIFFARLRMSELEPGFAPISATWVRIDNESGKKNRVSAELAYPNYRTQVSLKMSERGERCGGN